MALFSDKFYPLCPLPTTATMGQTLYIPINYWVIFQFLAPALWELISNGEGLAPITFHWIEAHLDEIEDFGWDATLAQQQQVFHSFF